MLHDIYRTISIHKRSKKPRISIEDRGRILAFQEMGLTYRTIAIRVGGSVGSVHYVLKKKKETGTVKDKPITGRKRATTQRPDRIMTRISIG